MECFQLIILVDSPVPTTEHKEFDFGSISIKYRIFLFLGKEKITVILLRGISKDSFISLLLERRLLCI